jgi:hypothetical protein
VRTELPTCWLSADDGLASWRWLRGRCSAELPTSSSGADQSVLYGEAKESPKQSGGLGMADSHGPYVGPTPINKLLITGLAIN